MPGIGDLLAEITGDKPAQAASSKPSAASGAPPRPSPATKRKAEDDLGQGSAVKTQRTAPVSGGYQGIARLAQPPKSSPAARSVDKPAPAAARLNSAARPVEKPAVARKASSASLAASRPSNGGHNGSNGSNKLTVSSPAPKRPMSSAASPVGPSASKAPPKKGSFAEIMARAQAAQATMGPIGRIQHKPVEKGASKKEREEMKADMRASLKKNGTKAPAPSRPGGPASRAGPSNGGSLKDRARDRMGDRDRNRDQDRDRNRNRVGDRGRDKKVDSGRDEQKTKRPVPSTGYQGTARARPNAPKKKDAPRGGALLNARPARHGSGTRGSRYEDDYDEELDDFIEYDDEEEDGRGGRYDYASDGSSDMEAGLDDIDEEEYRAEVIARKEDLKEEREEAARKKAKEERKRQALLEAQRERRR